MKFRPGTFALLVLLGCAAPLSAAVVFNASGTASFGGAVGGSSMSWSDDGTIVSVTFTKGAGNFNDRFVLYLDNGTTGRSSIGPQVNDRGDALRSAITFMESATGKTLVFPTGFDATHAIAMDTGFTGLWSIPATGNVGNNQLPFVAAVTTSFNSASQSSFTFSFNVGDLGITPNSGSTINFVATYLNPYGGDNSLGFASNEGYGGGFPGSNIGQNDFAFTSFNSYTIVPEPSAVVLGVIGGLFLLRRRR